MVRSASLVNTDNTPPQPDTGGSSGAQPALQTPGGNPAANVNGVSSIPASGSATAPSGGFDTNSIVDYLSSQGQASGFSDRTKLYNQTFGQSGGQYTGSASQNMALLTKLRGGYSGSTTNADISGSGSVAQHNNVKGAVDAAGTALAPKAPEGPSMGGDDENADAPVDEETGAPKTSLQIATDQYEEEAKLAIKQLEAPFNQEYKSLQEQQKQAMAAAEQEYIRAGGVVASTGMQEYVGNVQRHYQDQLDKLQMNFNLQKQEVLSNKISAIQKTELAFQENATNEFKGYIEGWKMGDGVEPDSETLMDALQTAMDAGISASAAMVQIRGALAYAKRQNKSSSSDSGSSKKLTLAQIEGYKEDHPEFADKIRYGMTEQEVADILEGRDVNLVLDEDYFRKNYTTKELFHMATGSGIPRVVSGTRQDEIRNFLNRADDKIDEMVEEGHSMEEIKKFFESKK